MSVSRKSCYAVHAAFDGCPCLGHPRLIFCPSLDWLKAHDSSLLPSAVVVSATVATCSHSRHCCIGIRSYLPLLASWIRNLSPFLCLGITLGYFVSTLALILWRNWPMEVSHVLGTWSNIVDSGLTRGNWPVPIIISRWSLLISIILPVLSDLFKCLRRSWSYAMPCTNTISSITRLRLSTPAWITVKGKLRFRPRVWRMMLRTGQNKYLRSLTAMAVHPIG